MTAANKHHSKGCRAAANRGSLCQRIVQCLELRPGQWMRLEDIVEAIGEDAQRTRNAIGQLERVKRVKSIEAHPDSVEAENKRRNGSVYRRFQVPSAPIPPGFIGYKTLPRKDYKSHERRKPTLDKPQAAAKPIEPRPCCRCRKPFKPATNTIFACAPCRDWQIKQGSSMA